MSELAKYNRPLVLVERDGQGPAVVVLLSLIFMAQLACVLAFAWWWYHNLRPDTRSTPLPDLQDLLASTGTGVVDLKAEVRLQREYVDAELESLCELAKPDSLKQSKRAPLSAFYTGHSLPDFEEDFEEEATQQILVCSDTGFAVGYTITFVELAC